MQLRSGRIFAALAIALVMSAFGAYTGVKEHGFGVVAIVPPVLTFVLACGIIAGVQAWLRKGNAWRDRRVTSKPLGLVLDLPSKESAGGWTFVFQSSRVPSTRNSGGAGGTLLDERSPRQAVQECPNDPIRSSGGKSASVSCARAP